MQREFVAYLRGIETNDVPADGEIYLIYFEFVAYLRGIETDFSFIELDTEYLLFVAYLRGIETRPRDRKLLGNNANL